jgi:hypothetical protein
MLQEIIVRKTSRFTPDTSAELGLAIKEEELQNLKPDLNRTLPNPTQFQLPPESSKHS